MSSGRECGALVVEEHYLSLATVWQLAGTIRNNQFWDRLPARGVRVNCSRNRDDLRVKTQPSVEVLHLRLSTIRQEKHGSSPVQLNQRLREANVVSEVKLGDAIL